MSTKEFWEKIISRKVMLTISIEQRLIGVYSLRGEEQKESNRENLVLHIVVGREYIDLVQWRNLECMEYLLNWFNGLGDWDYHPTSLHWVCVRDQNAIEVVQCSPKQFWKFRGSQCKWAYSISLTPDPITSKYMLAWKSKPPLKKICSSHLLVTWQVSENLTNE